MATRSQYKRYSNQEYRALAEVLEVHYRNLDPASHYRWTPKRAKYWMWLYPKTSEAKVTMNLTAQPLENMPLLINSTHYLERIVSIWRLKIAR